MEKKLFTKEGAIKCIRAAKAGARFCVRVRSDAPIEGEESEVFRMGLSGYANISRAAAIRLCSDLLSPALESRGARIPISTQSLGPMLNTKHERVIYWIG